MPGFEPDLLKDTITALGTPPGRGAIGLIRISGDRSPEILDTLFRPARSHNNLASYRMCYGQLVDPDSNQIIDQVMVTLFKSPHTYTGQDMGEISFHGSPVLARDILNIILNLGARLAMPGEFTMRAFLAGKMDLIQAEAVKDLVDSRTSAQARLAEKQLEGSVSQTIQPLKERLIQIISLLETAIEFTEESPETGHLGNILEQIHELGRQFSELEKKFHMGDLIREGFTLVITGKPNVGKSSLFNRLLGEERAIVTHISGTTRDLLREQANVFGIPVTFMDTAGIRSSRNLVEQMGVEKSYSAMAQADVTILVLDASSRLEESDETLLTRFQSRQVVIALNKSDRPSLIAPDLIRKRFPDIPVMNISALTGSGIEELKKKIKRLMAPELVKPEMENNLVTNLRQQRCIHETFSELENAYKAGLDGLSEEFILYHLHQSLHHLDELTGKTTVDDILGKIFSAFCIGK